MDEELLELLTTTVTVTPQGAEDQWGNATAGTPVQLSVRVDLVTGRPTPEAHTQHGESFGYVLEIIAEPDDVWVRGSKVTYGIIEATVDTVEYEYDDVPDVPYYVYVTATTGAQP